MSALLDTMSTETGERNAAAAQVCDASPHREITNSNHQALGVLFTVMFEIVTAH